MNKNLSNPKNGINLGAEITCLQWAPKEYGCILIAGCGNDNSTQHEDNDSGPSRAGNIFIYTFASKLN